VAQLITENETLQHQLHSLRSSMATPAITVRATPVPSETPSATPLPLSVMAEQVSASHQSRSPSLPLPLTPVEAHFTQQQIEEQEAIWNTIQQQRRQPLQQSQSARSLPLETSITTPPTTLSRQASHPAPMTSQQAHQYFNTYSNHTMAAQTKYVCCGMCRQWLQAPRDARMVHCPMCRAINDCSLHSSVGTVTAPVQAHPLHPQSTPRRSNNGDCVIL